MKKKGSEASNAQQLQDFMREAADRFPDLLALDGEAAWKHIFADRPILFGLRTRWRYEQTRQAALRALQAVAPRAIPLETEGQRRQLVTQMLDASFVPTDTVLMTWMRELSSSGRRLFEDQVEQMYLTINLPGYRAIIAEAARLSWPTIFWEDVNWDAKILCTPGAPKRFWWAIRPAGTDLYQPNDLLSVEWALARKKHGPDEQRYYCYTGSQLRHITLDALIVQLVHTLNITSYEEKRQKALTTELQERTRFRELGATKAYYDACLASKQAEEALRKVKRLKQQYS